MQQKKNRTFFKVFWPSLIAVILVSIIGNVIFYSILGGVVGGLTEKPAFRIEENGILELKLEGEIKEKSSVEVDPLSMGVNYQVGLADLLYGIKEAKSDKKIKGIYIHIGNLNCGMASLKELRNALKDFQKSNKILVAYLSGEVITQKQYYLASVTNEIYAFPGSMFEFVGLSAEMMFFKNALDKLGVDVEIIRGHDNHFKSAVEPFFLDKMSDSSKVQVSKYINSIWNEMLIDISASTGLSNQKLNELANNLTIKRADDAAKNGLIKGVCYEDEMINLFTKKGLKNLSANEKFTSLEKYAQVKFQKNQSRYKLNDSPIAVLLLEGDITVDGDGIASNKVLKQLREIKANKKIKGLILRINSPGGSALASDEIWRELKLIKKSKKIVVSMGDVAASGGYYIATPASTIFAEPTTITGSIGVFGMIPYTGKMLEDNVGISFDRVTTNKHSSLSLNRKLTTEELSQIQGEVDEIYEDFINRVKDGRKMSKSQVHKLARGRVWTGIDAKIRGLVDKIGGLNDAINYLAKELKIKEVNCVYYPKYKEDPLVSIVELLKENEISSIKTNKNLKIPNEFISSFKQIENFSQYQGVQMRLPYLLEIN